MQQRAHAIACAASRSAPNHEKGGISRENGRERDDDPGAEMPATLGCNRNCSGLRECAGQTYLEAGDARCIRSLQATSTLVLPQMKKLPPRFIIALLLVTTAWSSETSTFFFLKVDSIPGESTISGHQNEIEVLSYSTGVSNTGTAAGGSGGAAGKASFHDLSVTKFVDGTSPQFLLACATGKQLPTVELFGVRRAKGVLQEYLTLKLFNVIVTSVSSGGSAGDQRQVESLSFSFSKVEFTVRKLNSDGDLGSGVTVTWDLKTVKSS